MAKHVVTHLYLSEEASIERMIERVTPQLKDGHPVLIWRADGVMAYVSYDPDKNLMGGSWLRTFAHHLNTLHDRFSPTGS